METATSKRGKFRFRLGRGTVVELQHLAQCRLGRWPTSFLQASGWRLQLQLSTPLQAPAIAASPDGPSGPHELAWLAPAMIGWGLPQPGGTWLWTWPSETLSDLASGSYGGAYQRQQESQRSANPLVLTATQLWGANQPELPQDEGDFWQRLINFAAGFAEVVTGGLSGWAIRQMGLQDYVNTRSAYYRAGGYVGQIANIALSLVPGWGLVLAAVCIGMRSVQLASKRPVRRRRRRAVTFNGSV